MLPKPNFFSAWDSIPLDLSVSGLSCSTWHTDESCDRGIVRGLDGSTGLWLEYRSISGIFGLAEKALVVGRGYSKLLDISGRGFGLTRVSCRVTKRHAERESHK